MKKTKNKITGKIEENVNLMNTPLMSILPGQISFFVILSIIPLASIITMVVSRLSLNFSSVTAFNDTEVAQLANEISKNCYIIIGIFALFRIALMLINSIINPDKLTDKQEGYGNMIARLIITITLFVAVPIIFDKSRELQDVIINNNYISKS